MELEIEKKNKTKQKLLNYAAIIFEETHFLPKICASSLEMHAWGHGSIPHFGLGMVLSCPTVLAFFLKVALIPICTHQVYDQSLLRTVMRNTIFVWVNSF